MSKAITLGITAGDINGIGPEVAVKAACRDDWPEDLTRVLIGHAGILLDYAEGLGLDEIEPWSEESEPGSVCIWQPEGTPDLSAKPGEIDADASLAAAAWITSAVEACQQGKFDGMVTGPICKEGFKSAGVDVPGHTEMLQQLTGSDRVAMLLVGGPLRVALVTRHLPIREVADAITPEAIREAVELLNDVLPMLGLFQPEIAVCGLNPHAGDGGTIGTEDRDVIAPVVAELKKEGFPVQGPVPADTVFKLALEEEVHAIVAMYHDQGLAPLKMLAFDIGVNVTLGLPIIRTSPDHGTAFDIAGKGIAYSSSMEEAIRLADKLARQKNPWA